MWAMVYILYTFLCLLVVGSDVLAADDDSCGPRDAVLASETGELQVLALIDLHGPGSDGQPCTVLDTEALTAMEALVWMVADINEREVIPGIKMGYTIYDTCEDPGIVSSVMSAIISKSDCSNNAIRLGLIMTTGEESTRASIKWMSLIRLPHIVIPKDSQAILSPSNREDFSPYTLAIPDASSVLIQVLPDVLSFMNSTYAVTVSGGYPMKQLANTFRISAFKEGICIPNHIPFNPVTEEIVKSRLYDKLALYPSSKAVLAFLQPEDIFEFKNAAESSEKAEDYFWLLIANSSQEISLDSHIVDPAQNFLIVQPHHVLHAEFRDYFINKTMAKQFENPYMKKYIEDTFKCYFDAMKPGHSKHCSRVHSAEMEREFRDSPRIVHVMKSLKAMISSVEDAWTRKCRMREGMCSELAELDPRDLMKYLANVRTSFGKNRRDMMAVRFADGIMSRGVAISIFSFGPKGTKLHQLGIFDGGRLRMNQSAFEVIKANLPKSRCDKCEQCRSVDEGEILYTDRSSDAYFTGIFYPPPDETVCSLMRVQAMETFYLALQLEKDGEEDRFSGVNFGAILVEDNGIYRSTIDSTPLPEDERILPPIHTLGRVNIGLSDSNPAMQQKLVGGAGSETDENKVVGMAKYLKSQKIRYVSLVYSSDRKHLAYLRNIFLRSDICFATTVNISTQNNGDNGLGEWELSKILHSLDNTPYCLVAIDNVDMIQNIMIGMKNFNTTLSIKWIIPEATSINWSFLPKHHSVLTLAPPAKYHNAIQNHFNQITGYDIAVKTWLADYYRGCSRERKTADITEMSDPILLYGILMAVKKIVQYSNSVYYEVCDTKGLCEKYFQQGTNFRGNVLQKGIKTIIAFEVPWDIIQYKIYGGTWRGQTFGTIDENGGLHGVGVSDTKPEGAEAECTDWCPHCSLCSDDPAPDLAPLVPGELNIAALLHAHAPGPSALDCGPVYHENEDMQLVEGFLYAVETARKRNPGLKLWNKATVGGVVLDTCTSITKTLQTIANMESCTHVFEYENESDFLRPESILTYLSTEPVGPLVGMVHDIDKVIVGTGVPGDHNEENDGPVEIMPYYVKLSAAMLDLLRTFNWTFIGLVLSEKDASATTAEVFINMISESEICVGTLQIINEVTNTDEVVAELDRIDHLRVIILFTTAVDTIKLLNSVKHGSTRHFQWVLLDTNQDAVNVVDVRDYAIGAVAIRSKVEPDPGFRDYYHALSPETNSRNPWFTDFWERKFRCRLGLKVNAEEKKDWALCTGREKLNMDFPNPLIPFIFESVDMIVRAMDSVIDKLCEGSEVLCRQLAEKPKVSELIRESLRKKIGQPWTEDTVDSRVEQTEFTLLSYQLLSPGTYKYVQVAKYQHEKLELGADNAESDDDIKIEPGMSCSDCVCLNLSSGKGFRHHLTAISGRRGQKDIHVSYIGAIWITVVLTIAGIGVIVCFSVIGYIIYKKVTKSVENGTVMGVLLLLGIALLYASTITFAVPPNQTSCGLRIFLVAFAYTFCYAVILLKAMNLRSVRFLGIGGEVSHLNEYLCLIFILAVQVSLSIQWWLYHPPLATITHPGHLLQACTYTRLDYAKILIYPLLILLIAAVYSITVRQMKQNCHEIKFLLIACWLCIISSFTWYLVLVVGSEKVREPTICVGSLVCATLMLVAIFLPKVHLLATMKYNLNKIAFDGFGRNYRGTPGGTSSTEFTFYDVSGIRPKTVNRVNFNEGRNTDSLTNNYKF